MDSVVIVCVVSLCVKITQNIKQQKVRAYGKGMCRVQTAEGMKGRSIQRRDEIMNLRG